MKTKKSRPNRIKVITCARGVALAKASWIELSLHRAPRGGFYPFLLLRCPKNLCTVSTGRIWLPPKQIPRFRHPFIHDQSLRNVVIAMGKGTLKGYGEIPVHRQHLCQAALNECEVRDLAIVTKAAAAQGKIHITLASRKRIRVHFQMPGLQVVRLVKRTSLTSFLINPPW